jgi:quercetin dioxygenase-like cupin family protein
MSITNRTVTNTVTGETITFLETSAERGGVRVVAQITLTPGGSVIPHSHRVSESFECLDGSFITHLAGKEIEFLPGQRMIAQPHEMHGFRNDTAQPATLKVTATPAGDLDRTLRTLSGLSRDGLLVPGKPPRPAFAMASLAWRGRYYQPPLPRWLYWTMMGAMAPFGARACDRLMARYNEEGHPASPQPNH